MMTQTAQETSPQPSPWKGEGKILRLRCAPLRMTAPTERAPRTKTRAERTKIVPTRYDEERGLELSASEILHCVQDDCAEPVMVRVVYSLVSPLIVKD